jgi:hypothetical protein
MVISLMELVLCIKENQETPGEALLASLRTHSFRLAIMVLPSSNSKSRIRPLRGRPIRSQPAFLLTSRVVTSLQVTINDLKMVAIKILCSVFKKTIN